MYKIMLADDEGIVIDALKFIIEKNLGDNCVIEYAKTGRSVIELAESFRPDIAVMDIQMPGINGIEAMREIRRTNPRTVFIIMSAYDKFDYAKEAINLGVMEYLTKPINKERILETLRKAMAKIDEDRERRSNDLRVKEKLETVVPIIENGLMYNILLQERCEEDINNYKQLLGISQNYGYMLVLVCGEEQKGSHMTNAVGTSIRMQKYYKEVRESLKEYFTGIIGSIMANKISMLIPYEHSRMEYSERIEIIEKSRELVRKLRKRLDISFRIGIGSIMAIEKLADSYGEAVNALVNTTGSVAHIDDLPMSCEYEEDYPVETEKKLFEAIEKGDYDQTVNFANQYFDWMEETYPDCIMDIRVKVLEFVLWAEHLAYENGGMTYQFRSRKDYLPELMAENDLEELRRWFVKKISDSSKNVATKREEKSNSSVEKAKVYIDKYYYKDISLDDVSKEIEISPYYFSKIFKEETGVNFIEYLTQIRMDRAKELLTDSSYSMKEICAKIGYADPNYFSRTFKKNVGVTPTEYKEGKRHGESA